MLFTKQCGCKVAVRVYKCLLLTDSHQISKFSIHYTPEEHSLSHAPILYYMSILFITTQLHLVRLKLVPPYTQLAKPFICLYNVGVVFGEHEDSRSNQSEDQSNSEECF